MLRTNWLATNQLLIDETGARFEWTNLHSLQEGRRWLDERKTCWEVSMHNAGWRGQMEVACNTHTHTQRIKKKWEKSQSCHLPKIRWDLVAKGCDTRWLRYHADRPHRVMMVVSTNGFSDLNLYMCGLALTTTCPLRM